jgi:hypothetical protein
MFRWRNALLLIKSHQSRRPAEDLGEFLRLIVLGLAIGPQMLPTDLLNVSVVIKRPPATDQMAIFDHGFQEAKELRTVMMGANIGGHFGELVDIGVAINERLRHGSGCVEECGSRL